jgi:glycosyltransferase involved in cell wall biosynthesis
VTAPRVSLVLPSLNHGAYVGAAVESVLAQTFGDLELLVQDAGSTDTTREILAGLDDPRLRVVVEADYGQADAVNRGFARARGEILGWVNADDELEPDAVERALAAFDADATAELVYGRGWYVDEAGARLRPYAVLPFDPRLLLTRDYILQPAAFWRRSLWERVGPLDASLHYAFDWDWFVRASRTTRFRLLEADLARYRLTGVNKSLVGADERQEELARVARRHGGRRQPTYLYWRFSRLRRRFPALRLVEPVLWRLFPGRIMA